MPLSDEQFLRDLWGACEGIVTVRLDDTVERLTAPKAARKIAKLKGDATVLVTLGWARRERIDMGQAACVRGDLSDLWSCDVKPSMFACGEEQDFGLWLLDEPTQAWEIDVAAAMIEASIGSDLVRALTITKQMIPLVVEDGEIWSKPGALRSPFDLSLPLSMEEVLAEETHQEPQRYAISRLLELPALDHRIERTKQVDRLRAVEESREILRREREQRAYAGRPEDADRSYADQAVDPAPPSVDTIEGLLGEGHNLIITGKRGSGKTTLAYQIAVTLVDDEDLFDVIPTTFPPDAGVGIVNLEMGRRDVRSTFDRLRPRRGDRIFTWTHSGVAFRGAGGEDLAAWCRTHAIHTLMIDSLRRAVGAAVDDSNSNSQLDRFFESVDEFKIEAGLRHVVFVAHPPRHAPDQVLGGMVSEAWTDELWAWETSGSDEPLRTLRLTKQRNLESPATTLTLQWDRATGRNLLASEILVGAALTLADKGLLAVARNPDVRGASPMRAKVLGVSGNRRSEALEQAESAGFISIERVRPFTFALRPAGEERLAELGEAPDAR